MPEQKKRSYDPDCEDLARMFLEDEPELSGCEPDLAQAIQDAIEAWLDENRPQERGE